MIARHGKFEHILGQRGKYNQALEDILANHDDSHLIMDVNVAISGPRYFTLTNHLNVEGERRY